MKLSLVDKLPILPHMPMQTKLVRRRAPRYIKSIIEGSKALPEIDSIEELRPENFNALTGGNLSATYLVRSPGNQVVIKLRTSYIEAEAESLIAWKKRRVRTPKAISYGLVPVSRYEKLKIKYLILEAIIDSNGRVAESAHDYLVVNPGKSRTIGRLLGAELNKMHSAIAQRSFGDFADSDGNKAAFRSWNSYIIGYIELHQGYLISISDEASVKAVKRFIKQHRFSSRPRYVHGDFSIRNALISSYDPMKLYIFDPNPIIGDPSWDIAVVANNFYLHKTRMFYNEDLSDLYRRDQQIWIGFRQTYTRKIDAEAVLLARLVHSIFQIGYENDKKRWRDDPATLKAYESMMRGIIKKLASAKEAKSGR